MTNNVKPIPDGYHTATPSLVVENCAQALEFYKKAFGAKEIMRMDMNGKIMHAEIQIGNSRIMLCDEFPEMHAKSPKGSENKSASVYLYLENADVLFKQALVAGAKSYKPMEDQFYGDRAGAVQDPSGHIWWLATHTKDVSKEEIQRQMPLAMAAK